MNTDTHTPGPWKVENWKYTESLAAWRRDGVPTIIGGNDAIAEVFNLYRPNAEDDAESEAMANARLIAAAPEMLAALEELCADKYLADPINADRMGKAKAALAKVKGGEP
jgi:hypothetical protein